MTNGTTTAGVRGPGGDGLPASRAVAVAAARAASEKQAEDIVVLDVSEVIVITDYFVLCTATSARQVKTVIEAVEDTIRRTLGVRPVRREGEADAGWWLLDYVDVVVHVFGVEEREYYDLERLWRDAPVIDWENGDEVASGSR